MRSALAACDGVAQALCTAHTAIADGLLLGRCPAAENVFPSEMNDGVEAFERFGIETRTRTPLDLRRAALCGMPNQPDDAVAAPDQRRNQGAADQA